MVLTETGKNVFDGICEDGRIGIGIGITLLEDGRSIVELYSYLIITLLQKRGISIVLLQEEKGIALKLSQEQGE